MEVGIETLRSLTINRITSDLIEGTLAERDSLALLLVDDYSSKILSAYMTVSEILNLGIFSIESINKQRQAFPNYEAIYFVSPTLETCRKLANDFSEIKKPKYSRIHIYFTHQIPEEILNEIITNGIIKRAITCKELNLSYYARQHNVFDFGFVSGLKIFNTSKDNRDKLLHTIRDRLLTVCASLNICPYIQYQKDSELCSNLCEKLEVVLKNFGKSRKLNRGGILLLTDRTIDTISPLLHDYNYEAIVYDLFDIKDDTLELRKKKIQLNDKDDLWNTYRQLHIAQVFNQLPKDLEAFRKSDISKIGDVSNLDSFEGMSSTLSGMGEYKLKTTQFSNHITLAEEVNIKYKEKRIFNIIELEQDIVTGENESGKIKNRDIFKNFTILKSKIQNQRDDFIRLLVILCTSLSIGDKDFSVLSGKLSEEEQALFNNLSYLGITKNSENQPQRRESFNIIREKLSNLKSKLSEHMSYSSLRSSPQLELIVEKASNFALDLKKFPFKNWDKSEFPKVEKKFGTKNLFGAMQETNDSNDELGTLILFNIGGISRNEIVAIEKLKKNNKVNHKIVIGSTHLLTASEYIKEIRDITKGQSEALIKTDLLE